MLECSGRAFSGSDCLPTTWRGSVLLLLVLEIARTQSTSTFLYYRDLDHLVESDYILGSIGQLVSSISGFVSLVQRISSLAVRAMNSIRKGKLGLLVVCPVAIT